jgi:hypothetical protein
MRAESRSSEQKEMAISRRQHGKYVSAARNKHATIDELLGAMLSMRSVPYVYDYITKLCGRQAEPRVVAGSNISTVTLRVVGGDEKGSLKSETVKYGHECEGTRTGERLRWRGPPAYTKERPVVYDERTSHKNKTVTVKE